MKAKIQKQFHKELDSLKDSIASNNENASAKFSAINAKFKDLMIEYKDTDPDNNKSKNSGEWAEAYVFLRILEQGFITSNTEINGAKAMKSLPIIKIIRAEDDLEIHYFTSNIENNDKALKIYLKDNPIPIAEPTRDSIKSLADKLYHNIINKPKQSKEQQLKTFEEIKYSLRELFVYKIKSPSSKVTNGYGGKSDITLIVKNLDYSYSPLEFSIKSALKQDPSIVNSSKSNVIHYEIENCNDDIMNEVNKISTAQKVIDRTTKLREKCKLQFSHYGKPSPTTYENMQLIADNLPIIIPHALLYAFTASDENGTNKSVIKVCEKLIKNNPLGIKAISDYTIENYYKKRLKDYLYAHTCDMTDAYVWNGTSDISGGYVFVKKDGSFSLIFLSQQNTFKDWLFNNSRFDTPSSSDDTEFKVTKINNKYYYNLPVSVRVKC